MTKSDKGISLITGQEITRIYSLKSMFDGDCLGAILDTGEHVRLPIKEIYKVLNDMVFDLVKKRVHTHLIVNIEATEVYNYGH